MRMRVSKKKFQDHKNVYFLCHNNCQKNRIQIAGFYAKILSVLDYRLHTVYTFGFASKLILSINRIIIINN
jgi:hypothetical protein